MAPISEEHLDTDVEALVLQVVTVVGRKTHLAVVLCMLVDLEDQVSAVEEDIGYLEDIVRL